MEHLRVLTVQDLSCVGQCSLTAALPVLSVCGLEAAALPTAVLSTHTGGAFASSGYTFRNLTEDIPDIAAHWAREHIRFAAVQTGYLGSARQAELVRRVMDTALLPGGLRIVDPAMADSGKLYVGLGADMVRAMAQLAFSSDVLLPNLTEAALLTELPYQPDGGADYGRTLLEALRARGARTVVLTGVRFAENRTGTLVLEGERVTEYRHARVMRVCHGTGDLFTAAFTGAYLTGHGAAEAARIAAEFVLASIRATEDDPAHWYGVHFESQLGRLLELLKKQR